MTSPTLLATWMRILIAEDSVNYIVEHCVRDTRGLELWERSLHTRGLRDAGITQAVCAGLAAFAKQAQGNKS